MSCFIFPKLFLHVKSTLVFIDQGNCYGNGNLDLEDKKKKLIVLTSITKLCCCCCCFCCLFCCCCLRFPRPLCLLGTCVFDLWDPKGLPDNNQRTNVPVDAHMTSMSGISAKSKFCLCHKIRQGQQL